MKITVPRGFTYNVVVKGSGPAVLLLHGFPDSSTLWTSQVDVLASSGFTAVAPDMLGYGASEKPQDPPHYKLGLIVGDLLAILDHLGVGRAHVVGHDWGAATAWRLCMMSPSRVLSLTALSVGHPGGGTAAGGMQQRSRWWYFMFFQYRGVAEESLRKDDWRLFREFMAGESSDTVDAYVSALSPPGALTAALNWYRANFHPSLFGGTGFRDFPPLRLPVMGVWSRGDAALLEEQMVVSERWVEAGKWRYERLEGGHWMPRTATGDINRLLLDFLKGAGSHVPSRL